MREVLNSFEMHEFITFAVGSVLLACLMVAGESLRLRRKKRQADEGVSFSKWDGKFDPARHKGHGIEPVGLFWCHKPGFSCARCGIWAELSHKEFKKTFGMTFVQFKIKLNRETPAPKGFPRTLANYVDKRA